MRSALAAFVILALAACGDSGPSVLDLDEVRIVKVAGDQSAVAGTSQATPLHSVSASPRFAVTAGETWTPEPLVGRIETVGARTNGLSGPSMLPPDMLAHWHLPEEAGRLLAASTPPDDSLHIVNRWAPSTRAGEYTAVARRILADGSVHEDARWTLVVEPGPIAVWGWGGHSNEVTAGDTIDMLTWPYNIRDAYENKITIERIIDSGIQIGWAWTPLDGEPPAAPVDMGWETVVPEQGVSWPPNVYGMNAKIHVYVDGQPIGWRTMQILPRASNK